MANRADRTIEELKDFIEKGTSPFHVVEETLSSLQRAGFSELSLTSPWTVEEGGAYYARLYDTSLLAFVIGERVPTGTAQGLRIAAAHTDFPNLRIKPKPTVTREGYRRLNMEVYGGLIRSSWLDRPLSIAGRVALKTDDPLRPALRLVDFRRPVATIPSLAIHYNRKVNEGVEIKPQKELLPLVSLLSGEEKRAESDADAFVETIAKELDVSTDVILSYELGLYVREQGETIGFDGALFSAPRLDNLTSVKAICSAVCASKESLHRGQRGISVAALFDHEEVGSSTKQGAGSFVFRDALIRLYHALGRDEEALLSDMAAGMMLSVDVAHGYHPAYDEKYDPTNHARLGGGIAIKSSARQSYASDAPAIAIVKAIAEVAGIPVQQAVSHADITGGATLGSIASTRLPIRTLDIGVPILSMHSARETMGTRDQAHLEELLTAFYRI